MILDTDLLVGFLRNDKDALIKINELNDSGEKLTITSITCFELYKGAYKSSSAEKNLNLVSELINKINNVMVVDLVASRITAKIYIYLEKRGLILDLPDILIGAIALANNETIVTRNANHFKRIPDLNVIKW